VILNRRRASALLCVTPLVLLFATGCAQQEAPKEAPAGTTSSPTAGAVPPKPEGTFKVGLITPGKITDKGWSQSAYDGVQRIKAELGAEVSPPVEGPAPAEVEGAIRKLAEDGNQLIFLHASEYDDAAKNVAADPKFATTTFVVVGGRSTGPNLTPIQFSAGEATYLAGMLAAGLSKSHKVAAVGGVEIPIIKEAFQSFEHGAKALDPKTDVKITFTGDFDDTAKAKQQTQALLDAGVDVVIHNANAAGQGVAQAVQEKNGALFLGANAPQDDLATAKNVGSFIVDAPNAYLAVARRIKEGEGEGKAYPVGVKEKAVGLHYNPKFGGTVPADLKAKIETASAALSAGTLKP
jgi:basic membrane lipoprotein Med (substrate-binding protein (PBP1-ABC) superfamily)